MAGSPSKHNTMTMVSSGAETFVFIDIRKPMPDKDVGSVLGVTEAVRVFLSMMVTFSTLYLIKQ